MGIFKKIKDGFESMKRKYTKNPLRSRVTALNREIKKVKSYDAEYGTNYTERLQKHLTNQNVKFTAKGQISVTDLKESTLKMFEDAVPSAKLWIEGQKSQDKVLSQQALLEAELHAAEEDFKRWYETSGSEKVIAEDPEFKEMLSLMGHNWHYGRAPAYDLQYAAEMLAVGITDLEDF